MKNEKKYEGVIYEPSYGRKPPESKSPSKAKPSTARRSVAKRKQQKSQLTTFLMMTIAVGAIAAVAVFAAAYTAISNREPTVSTPRPTPPANTPVITDSVKLSHVTALLTNITGNPQQILALDLDTGKKYTLNVDGSAQLKDKYGKSLVFAELNVGMIVDLSFDTSKNMLSSLAVSARAWDFKQISGLIIDGTKKTISYGNTDYKYDNQMIVSYNRAEADINTITEMDVVSMWGLNDKVWYIAINKGHGFIKILQNPDIRDGKLEIDTNISMPLAEADQITLLEGPHRVVVRGSNIEPFSKEVIVSRLEEVPVDLNFVQAKSALLVVKSILKDFTFSIDDVEHSIGEPIVLGFGTYKLKAVKEGYHDWEQTLEVKSATVEVTVEMKEVIPTGKIVVNTMPEAETQVYIDGKYAGLSPYEGVLEYGNHTITLKKEGYTDVTHSIVVESKEFKYDFVLLPKLPVIP